MALPEQNDTDRYNDDTNPFYDQVDRPDHLGLFTASHGLCFHAEF